MPVAPRDPVPVRGLHTDDGVDRLALGVGGLRVEQLQVQLQRRSEPDRGRLELGGARLRVGRVDREHVRRHLVREVEVHEREPRPQRRVVARRRLDRAAPRDDPHAGAVGDAVALAVLGREQDRLAADVQRRREAVRLDARVEGLEPAPGREAQREIVVEQVDRRVVLDRLERRALRDDLVPEPAVDEQRARILVVPARPLDPAELLEPLRSSCPHASARATAARPTRPRPAASRGRGRGAGRARTRSRCRRALRPAGRSALRTSWTRRSLEVTVPSTSPSVAAAGRTTSASSAVRVRKRSWTTRWSRPSSSRWARCWSASPCAGFSPTT